MDGVRRWIGSSSPARHHPRVESRQDRKLTVRSKEVPDKDEDIHSTEYVATQLLAPDVSKKERLEYEE